MTMRSTYLEQIWKKAYPAAHPPSPGLIQGRVLQLGSAQVILLHDGREHLLRFEKGLQIQGGHEFVQVIQAGDIIQGETKDGLLKAVWLLVPSTGESPFKSSAFDFERARQWQEFLFQVRGFLTAQGFTELRTPTLVPSPGLEPFLDPFKTELQMGKASLPMFLPTSPEFHLKKALTLGFEKCFEFKECFRNGEMSSTHQPEFLMLEWYRAYATNDELIKDLELLCKKLVSVFGSSLPDQLQVFEMADLWARYCDFKLSAQTGLTELQSLARRMGVPSDDNDFDDLFARLFLEKIEPELAKIKNPLVIKYYPPSQAALARLTKEGWADRFEFYWSGLEVANAFHELNDSQEQRRRFRADQEKKRKLAKEVVPVDEEFLKALDWGMPPAAGIALGLDRLFMALMGIQEIGDTRLFPMRS